MVGYTDADIRNRRKYIHDELTENHNFAANFSSFTAKNLNDMFQLYDDIFFGGQIAQKLRDTNSQLSFKVTKGGKAKTAGWCQTRKGYGTSKCFITMSFPMGLYGKMFTKEEKSLHANGIFCVDRLNCLQVVFEHELMHALMDLYGYTNKISKGRGKAIYSAHGYLFKCMVKSYFGHTDIKHNLLGEDATHMIKKSDIRKGMEVSFAGRGMKYIGIVEKLNPKTVVITVTMPKIHTGKKMMVPYPLVRNPE